MKAVIRDLWLAILLIVLASLVLLLSDLSQRKGSEGAEEKNYPEIAVFQIASTPLLDNHVAGVRDQLVARGYALQEAPNIRFFNAQGDLPTANTMAREIVNGPYQLVITSSTLALQTMAKANAMGKKLHVFGAVTDPYGAGVGILGLGGDQHPAHLVGIGTFQPVEAAFRIARDLNPGLRRVGVVWNPGEQCSEACLGKARQICRELGIELIEAVATNTNEVAEAAKSLLARGVQALWVGGDTVAIASLGLLLRLANQAGVAVFTNDPQDANTGALFGLGARYFTVGQMTADLAIALLEGQDPKTIRVENKVPEQLGLNEPVLKGLGKGWKMTRAIQERLARETAGTQKGRTLDFADPRIRNLKDTAVLYAADRFLNLHIRKGRVVKIGVINLVENPLLNQGVSGLEQGLQESGLVSGLDYEIKYWCAQGEISQLPQLIDAAVRENPDVILTVTTPVFMAVAKKVRDIPVVFTVASDPAKLAVFKGPVPANICGTHDDPPVDQVLEMARGYVRQLKKVGIICDPSQTNARISLEKLRLAAVDQKVELLEATASQVSELGLAAQSLIDRGAQAFIFSADNLVSTGFASIRKVAERQKVPIFVTALDQVRQGATGAIGDDYGEWGRESGKMAARVLAGVPPRKLGVRPTSTHRRIEPGQGFARKEPARLQRLAIVLYSETVFAERSRDGIIDGIKKAGLREGVDFSLKTYNAQGDMSTLSSIMGSVKAEGTDLLLVVSTPALQAALRQAGKDTRIVFTAVADGTRAGAGRSETDHLPNVTGITTRSPFEAMARAIKESLPGAKRVGTLFTPAEINSVLFKDWYAAALAREGIVLEAVPVTAPTDVSQAADELCRKDIQAVGQIVDNMTRPGFALIARKASEKNIPVFVFDSDQMKDGGAVCISRDYYDAGLEAAAKAIRILRGESPAAIPFSNTKTEKYLYNPQLVEKYRVRLSPSFMKKATAFKPQ